MTTKIYNESNLKNNEIDVIVTRVKIYLINSNNEIMVASSNGGIQLPGGHVEEGESDIQACVREIKEETGIEIEKEIVPEPFFEIKHYSRNYKGQNINRIARIIYFVIKTNKTYDKQKTNLTENEKTNNFEIRSIPFEDFEKELTLVKETNPLEINRVIAEEILESFFVLKKTL